jgi:hypothetical protein
MSIIRLCTLRFSHTTELLFASASGGEMQYGREQLELKMLKHDILKLLLLRPHCMSQQKQALD